MSPISNYDGMEEPWRSMILFNQKKYLAEAIIRSEHYTDEEKIKAIKKLGWELVPAKPKRQGFITWLKSIFKREATA